MFYVFFNITVLYTNVFVLLPLIDISSFSDVLRR